MRTNFPQEVSNRVYELVESGCSFGEVSDKMVDEGFGKIKRRHTPEALSGLRYCYAKEKMRRDVYKRTPRYYVVGATWEDEQGKTVDKLPEFIEHQYWEMGWSDDDVPYFTERRNSMQVGDYIAVKRINGPGKIIIRAVGRIVRKVNGVVCVDWLFFPDTTVNMRGCMGTIHGPFDILEHKEEDKQVDASGRTKNAYNNWLREIFMLR